MSTLEQLHKEPTIQQVSDQPPRGGIFLPEHPIPPGYVENTINELNEIKERSLSAKARLEELNVNPVKYGNFQNRYLQNAELKMVHLDICLEC